MRPFHPLHLLGFLVICVALSLTMAEEDLAPEDMDENQIQYPDDYAEYSDEDLDQAKDEATMASEQYGNHPRVKRGWRVPIPKFPKHL